MAEEKEETVDKQEEDTNLDVISDIINVTMGAVVNIGAEVSTALEELKQHMTDNNQRLTDMEDLRQKQLLASSDQLEKIKQMEHEGLELMGTNLIANLLGTLNLVYEIMGKMEINVSRIDNRLNVIAQRETENLMEMKVINEQQRNVLNELGDFRRETVKLREQDKKIHYKTITVFMIIFLILASFAGVQVLLNAIRGI
jgi:hypothetical protein